jgi:bifunctional DNase/RNase
MEIDSVKVDKLNYGMFVNLKQKGRERYLRIRIGSAEADAIAVKLANVATPRPLTHDLICSLIQAVGGKVLSAVIYDMKEETFFAKFVVEVRQERFEFDCRPSDAIAVAVRAEAPIYVENSILDEFGISIHKMDEFD